MVKTADWGTIETIRQIVKRHRRECDDILSLLEAFDAQEPKAAVPLPESIPLGPRQPLNTYRVIGYRWMEAIMGFNIQPPMSFPAEYEWIGTQSEADRAKVALRLAQDPWVAKNRGLVTPRHLVRNWGRYMDPPKPPEPLKDFKTQREETSAAIVRMRLEAFDQETELLTREMDEEDAAVLREERMEIRMLLERRP